MKETEDDDTDEDKLVNTEPFVETSQTDTSRLVLNFDLNELPPGEEDENGN